MKKLVLILLILTIIPFSNIFSKTEPDTNKLKIGLGLNLSISRIFLERTTFDTPIYPLLGIHFVANRNFEFAISAWYSMTTNDNVYSGQNSTSSTFILTLDAKYLLLPKSKVSPYLGISYEYGSFPDYENNSVTIKESGYSIGANLGVDFNLSKYFTMYLHTKLGYSTSTYGDYQSYDNYKPVTSEAFSINNLTYGVFFKF